MTDERMRTTSPKRKLDDEDVDPQALQAQGNDARSRVEDGRHSTALTTLARLLGAIAAREHIAASCRAEGERDGP